MKPRRIIRFDEQFLRSLVDQKDSGVTVKKTRQHLLLRPIHLNDVEDSLKDVLRYGIAKYNKDLKGILLGFKDIKLLSGLGVIGNDSCGVHVDVSANFFVFEPEINAEMQGTVVRKSKDHIGVLVYNSFNVSIPKQHDDEVWLGASVNLGDEVKLSITYTDFNHRLPYIRGILLSIVARNPIVDTQPKAVKTKTKSVNRKIKFDEDGEAVDQTISHVNKVIESVAKGTNLEMDVEEAETSEKSNSKKRKKLNESGNVELIDSLLAQVKEEVSEKSKKRKRKQNEEPVTYNDGAIDRNTSHIDDATKELDEGESSERKSKGKGDKSDFPLPQIKEEQLEKPKKRKRKFDSANDAAPSIHDDDTIGRNISHIHDISESVMNKELEWNVEASGKKLKGTKRKLSESGNILIDSLLAQVKDEVLEKPKKKKRKLDAEQDGEVSDKPKKTKIKSDDL